MSDESQVESILGEWQESLDRGIALEPGEIIAAHPHLADRLQECFAVLLAVRIGDTPAPSPVLRTVSSDRYSLFRPVAEGGMGLVYWAIDNDLNREVALKVIRVPGASSESPVPASPGEIAPPLSDTPTSQAYEALRQRFLQEAWVTGGMAHPGIVPVYELGQTAAGMPYYTMRFVRGEETLEDALRGVENAPLEERLQLLEPFLKVCDTLEYAHAQGVVHRDLKPENIALGQFGEVVVLDWGLAKLLGQPSPNSSPWRERLRIWREDTDLRTASSALGTPGYMAPEATAGRIGEIDERSDVYSLGAILFRILTGRRVPPAETVDDGQHALQPGPPAPHTVLPSVPPALSALCQAALAGSKEDRPATVGEFAGRVRQWQTQTRLDHEVEGWVREGRSRLDEAGKIEGSARIAALDRVLVVCERVLERRPENEPALSMRAQAQTRRGEALAQHLHAARRRLLVRAAGVLFVVGTLVVVFVARELDRRRDEAVGARRAAEQSLRRARTRGLVASSAEVMTSDPMLALLLARRAVARSASPSASGVSRLYNALVDSLERARFDRHDAEVTSAELAPEGDAVLTASLDGTARIWPIEGGAVRVLEHGEALRDAVFASTGRHVLTRPENGNQAVLWASTGERLAQLDGHEGRLHAACFSPSGTHVLTASADGTARLWDLGGKELACLRGHTAAVGTALFTPDGDRILTASGDGTVRLWTLEGLELSRLEGAVWIWRASFSPDGKALLVSFADWTSELWTLEGAKLAAYRGSFAHFSSDGTRVATTVHRQQVCVHDRDGKLLSTFNPPGGAASTMAFLPGEHRLAVACYDSTIRIWDPAGVHATTSLAGHTGWTEDISFSARGDRILTASRDGTTRLWAPIGCAHTVLRGHTGRIDAARYSPNGEHILTAARDKTARLWTASGTEMHRMPRATGTGVTFSPEGDRVVLCTADHVAHIWDLAGSEVAALRGHTRQIFGVIYSRGGQEILTWSKDDSIRRWSPEGQPLGTLVDRPDRPQRVRVSPDGDRLLITWVPPRPIAFVDSGVGATVCNADGTQRATLGSLVRTASFSPDGTRIVTGSYDGTVAIWDADGRRLARFQAHEGSLLCCRFAPDGRSFVTGSDDMTARVWDMTGRPLAALQGHAAPILQVAFDPSGKRILTGAFDRTARLWTAEGKPLATLRHGGNLAAVGFSPDGEMALTASFDGVARLWPVDTRKLLELADDRSTRDLTAYEKERYADLLAE